MTENYFEKDFLENLQIDTKLAVNAVVEAKKYIEELDLMLFRKRDCIEELCKLGDIHRNVLSLRGYLIDIGCALGLDHDLAEVIAERDELRRRSQESHAKFIEEGITIPKSMKN